MNYSNKGTHILYENIIKTLFFQPLFQPFRGSNPLETYLQMWAPQYGTPQTYYQYGGRVKRAVDPATEEELKQFASKIPFLQS